MKLRRYQTSMVDEQERLRTLGKDRILMVAPTGAGKTVVMSAIVQQCLKRSQRVLVLVHRDTLIRQTANKLQVFDIDHGLIKAGYKEHRSALVQVASVQSLKRRELFAADVIIFDECHTTTSYEICSTLFTQFTKAEFIGFTATPWVLGDAGRLQKLFPEMVTAPSYRELIDAGFLVLPRYFTYPDSDRLQIKGSKNANGDYTEKALNIACNTPKMVSLCVREFLRLAPNRTGICFAVGLDHAYALEAAFTSTGVKCAVVTGETLDSDRLTAYAALERKEIQLLISINVLTEGFDCPSIDVVVIIRPTISKSLNFQMIGRGLRPSPGKADVLILDFADNFFKHGSILELTADDYQDVKGDRRNAPLKVCPECGEIVSTTATECPECGHAFEVAERIEKEFIETTVSQLEERRSLKRVKTPASKSKKPTSRESSRENNLEEYKQNWERRGIKLIGKYTSTKIKTIFCCDKEHEWGA
ncbi:MAG: DEAD/DEAH box helicase, partial [Verrucomicrobia bacterium]|nr:DEAD/DEAH box helicase [Leptolyngbya sp. ES-bin-22]